MGLSLVELSLGRYPIPPPQQDELRQIFGPNALHEHLEAAKTGRSLQGGQYVLFQHRSIHNLCYFLTLSQYPTGNCEYSLFTIFLLHL